jgi:hypothetical protein
MPNQQLTVQKFLNADYTDAAFLGNTMRTSPTLLHHIMRLKSIGKFEDYQKNMKNTPLPIQALTFGRKANKVVNIGSETFRTEYMGKSVAAQPIIGLVNPNDSEPGLGGAPVEVLVERKYYSVGDHVTLEDLHTCRVSQVSRKGQYVCYELLLSGANPNDFISVDALRPGALLGAADASFAEGSIGGSTKTATFFREENQLQILKGAYSYTDIASAMSCTYSFMIDGKEHKTWFPLRFYELMDQFTKKIEHALMFSKTNLLPNGDVASAWKDENGRPIRTMRGLDETISRANIQSTNNISPTFFRYLVYSYVPEIYGDESVTSLLTGSGLADAFDIAMKSGSTQFTTIDTLFTVKGGDGYLKFGNYYNTIKTMTGKKITIQHLPMADDPERFPGTIGTHNFTPQSYKGYVTDWGDKDGLENIRIVTMGESGNNSYMFGGAVNGLVPNANLGLNPNSSHSDFKSIAHGSGESSIYLTSVCGLDVQDASNCVKIDFEPVS